MTDLSTLSKLVAPAAGVFVERAGGNTGAMVALFVPPRVAKRIALPDGEAAEELHVTLAYLGDAADIKPDDQVKLRGIINRFASGQPQQRGEINALARFCNTGAEDAKDAFVLLPDLPDLPTTRGRLLSELEYDSTFKLAKNHGYVPHITLAYIDKGAELPFDEIKEPIPVVFNKISLVLAGERYDFPLARPAADVERAGARHTGKEYKALNRIVELALELGGTSLEQKASQRHSRRDQARDQEIHNLSEVELGAICKAAPIAPPQLLPRARLPLPLPLLELATHIQRSQNDAPGYRAADTIRTCNNCIHSTRIKGDQWCDKFEFVHATDYVCDAWLERSPDSETPGLTKLADLERLIIKRGGPTSGNFKHRSIKGKHGGSAPGGGHRRIGIRPGDHPARISSQVGKHRQAAKQDAAVADMLKKNKKGALGALSVLPDSIKNDEAKLSTTLAIAVNKKQITAQEGATAYLIATNPKYSKLAGQADTAKNLEKGAAKAKAAEVKTAHSAVDATLKDKAKQYGPTSPLFVEAEIAATKYKEFGISPLAADQAVNNFLLEKVNSKEISYNEAKDVAQLHTAAKKHAVAAGGTPNTAIDLSKQIAPNEALIGATLKTTKPFAEFPEDAFPPPAKPSGGSSTPASGGAKSYAGQKKEAIDRVVAAGAERRSNAEMVGSAVGKKWTDGLPVEERQSVKTYTGGSYQEINGALRGYKENTTYTQNHITNIKSALDKSSLDKDTLVHRGISGKMAKDLLGEDPATWTGKKMRDKAFQSSTLNTKTAENFSSCCPRVVMDIKVPKGYKAGYLDHISNYKGEKELLIQAGSALKITGITQLNDNDIRIAAEYIFD